MWALVENNSVTRVYTRPTAVTIGFVAATYYDEDILYEEGDALPILSYYKHEDTLPEGKIAGDIKTQAEVGDVKIAAGSLKTPRQGTNYPANIMSMWTASELEAIGIYEVVSDNTNLKDTEYYLNGPESFNFADGVVTKSFGVATAKELADTLWTQEYIDSLPQAPEDVSVGDLQARGLTFIHKQRINNQASSILSETDWYRIRAEDGGAAMPANILTFRTTIRTESNTMCDLIDAAASVDALAALYVYNNNNPPTRPIGEFSRLE